MADTVTLKVSTPLGLALSTEATSVEARSVDGYFGVMPGHLPMLAALKGGVLKYEQDGKVKVAAVGPGFVQAEPDGVRILTDVFSEPSNVDVDAVRKELEELTVKMKDFGSQTENVEFEELERAQDWCEARLEAKRIADAP